MFCMYILVLSETLLDFPQTNGLHTMRPAVWTVTHRIQPRRRELRAAGVGFGCLLSAFAAAFAQGRHISVFVIFYSEDS